MLKILVCILMFPAASFADDVANEINNYEANMPAQAAAESKPSLPDGSGGATFQAQLNCLDAINKANAVTTKEYIQSGGDHFIFKDGVESSDPGAKGRGFIYANKKGLFYCPMNWPKPEGKGKKDFQFVLDGQIRQPYGPSRNNIGDVTSSCVKDPSNVASYFDNQLNANLRTYGQKQRADNIPRAKALSLIQSGCKGYKRAEAYFGEGYSAPSNNGNKNQTSDPATPVNN